MLRSIVSSRRPSSERDLSRSGCEHDLGEKIDSLGILTTILDDNEFLVASPQILSHTSLRIRDQRG